MITVNNGKVTIIVPVHNRKVMEGLSNADFSDAHKSVLKKIAEATSKYEAKVSSKTSDTKEDGKKKKKK